MTISLGPWGVFAFRRQRWSLLVLLIPMSLLIITVHHYAPASKSRSDRTRSRDTILPPGYNEVLQRWYNFSEEKEDWYNDERTSMFDEKLLEEIRTRWLMASPRTGESYVLREPEVHDTSMGQAREIMNILENKTNGFFIECGAYDGETRSNTLVLERFLGWSGILIEADPINFATMLGKRRIRAAMSPTCLSLKSYPTKVSFLMAHNIGRIHDPEDIPIVTSSNAMDVAHEGKHTKVQCFPLASYVAAFGVKTVDYFSLDIEGNEMEVLETIPFDRIDIRTLSVEYIHGKNGREHMINFMENKGYYVHSFVTREDNLANDVIFVKKKS